MSWLYECFLTHRGISCQSWGSMWKNWERETYISEIFKMLGFDFTILTQRFGNFWGVWVRNFSRFWFEWDNREKWDFSKWDFRNLRLFFSLFSLVISCTFSFMCKNSKSRVMLHQDFSSKTFWINLVLLLVH